MQSNFIFEDLGHISYKKAWDYQKMIFNRLIDNKKEERRNENQLLFCEHPHVFTIGKSGKLSNLLINKELLNEKGIEYYNIDRGGDITYHGPGQIVAYPLFDLDTFGIGTRDYVFKLEEIVIKSMIEFGIKCGRLESAAGIWLEPEVSAKSRKICAIGVRSSKRVTMHGLALNVNTGLSFFNYINPCGFTDKGVTSMEKELGKFVDIEIVKSTLLKNFQIEFGNW
ncbi:MAG: lipoyl(octanoyl) transferase LipB [Bacteroidota bacterium]